MNSVSVLVLAVIAIVIALAPMVWAADVVRGQDQECRPEREDGHPRRWNQADDPTDVDDRQDLLQPGVNVKANYEEKGGQKVATSLIVMPSR